MHSRPMYLSASRGKGIVLRLFAFFRFRLASLASRLLATADAYDRMNEDGVKISEHHAEALD